MLQLLFYCKPSLRSIMMSKLALIKVGFMFQMFISNLIYILFTPFTRWAHARYSVYHERYSCFLQNHQISALWLHCSVKHIRQVSSKEHVSNHDDLIFFDWRQNLQNLSSCALKSSHFYPHISPTLRWHWLEKASAETVIYSEISYTVDRDTNKKHE